MQVCILFTIALTLVSPELSSNNSLPSVWAWLAVVLLHCLVVLHAAVIALKTNPQASPVEAERRFNLLVQSHTVCWSLASIGCVVIAGFGSIAMDSPVIQIASVAQPLLARLCFVVPSVTSLLLSWGILFEAETSIGLPTPSISRWGYVLRKSRGPLLLPLTLLLTLVVWSDLVSVLGERAVVSAFKSTSVANMFVGGTRLLPLLGLVAAFPLFLRWFQAPECLPPSELRERIQRRCKQANFLPADLLIWNTGHSSRNAAVSGFAGRLRYILLSDRLLAEVDRDRIEKIVLHEVAHAKHGHSVKLLCVASSLIAGAACLNQLTLAQSSATVVAIMALFAAVGLTLFGQLARLFELQADLWAAETTGDTVEYLRAVADVASGHPDRATWLHPSFQDRCEFLLNGFEKAHQLLRSHFRTTVSRLVLWTFALPGLAFGTTIWWQCW